MFKISKPLLCPDCFHTNSRTGSAHATIQGHYCDATFIEASPGSPCILTPPICPQGSTTSCLLRVSYHYHHWIFQGNFITSHRYNMNFSWGLPLMTGLKPQGLAPLVLAFCFIFFFKISVQISRVKPKSMHTIELQMKSQEISLWKTGSSF